MTLARIRPGLATLGALVAAWAAAVWMTGGVAFVLGGIRVSSRNASRPALLAGVLIAAALWGSSAAERQRWLALSRRRGDRLAPIAAIALAVSVSVVSAVFGGHVASGSDASGYVSQSRLWAAGRLRAAAPDLVGGEWPARGWLVAPLGYKPSPVEGQLGPTYAPGLPWLMAVGGAVAGEVGRFIWTPFFVGALTWGTFLLARRDAPPLVALSAAALVATSPPVLFAAMQPMSDLPAAALWLGALLALASARPGAALISGACAAVALAVRPNLVLVAAAVWVADIAARGGTARARIMRAAQWAAPVALAAGAVGAVNAALWGSPGRSGYGDAGELVLAANVPRNLANLWRWTVETRGYWCLAGLAALVRTAVTTDRRRSWPAAALVGAVLASYLGFAVFDEWWYLRFYLPAWPVLAAAAAVAAWRVLARWSDDGAALIVAGVAVAIAASAVQDSAAHGTFDLWKGDQRYAAVAAFVHDQAPPGTVVLAVQHSGALAYYTQHAIARWDMVPEGGLDALCAQLGAAGRTTWLVVDDLEEAPFRRRFANGVRGRLDWAPVGEARVGPARVRVYDLTTPTRAVGPALIAVRTALSWPWTRVPRPPTAK